MRQIRTTIGATTINSVLLTAAERIQYEGYLRQEESNAAIIELSKGGATIKEIVRTTGFSRGLVRKILRGRRTDVFRVRESSLETYLPWLDEQWAAGARNGAELWRRLKQQGFRGCLRVVSEWAARRRRADETDASALTRTPSARTLTRLLTVRARSALKGRNDYCRSSREWHADTRGGARCHCQLPGYDSNEVAR